jgi:hypothetical protein
MFLILLLKITGEVSKKKNLKNHWIVVERYEIWTGLNQWDNGIVQQWITPSEEVFYIEEKNFSENGNNEKKTIKLVSWGNQSTFLI